MDPGKVRAAIGLQTGLMIGSPGATPLGDTQTIQKHYRGRVTGMTIDDAQAEKNSDAS